MSLLTIVQNLARDINVREPTSVVGSANRQVRELLTVVRSVGDDLLLWPWPELVRELAYTTVEDQDDYALPSDFNFPVAETYWKASDQEPMAGPINAKDWQELENGTIASLSQDYFRIKGIADRQFFIQPTPGADESITLEYSSRNWIRPRTWIAGQTYSAGQYTFYNGIYYQTSLGGSTGATPPTHTAGSESDGGVSWTYYQGLYEDFTADTDEVLLDEKLIELGASAFWRRSKRLAYQDIMDQYESQKRTKMGRRQGNAPISLSNRGETAPWPNIPQRIPYE